MEKLLHFSHDHLLSLVHMQWDLKNESSDEEEEEEYDEEEEEGYDEEEEEEYDESYDDEEDSLFLLFDEKCGMCRESIYTFQRSCYYCKDCQYYLHKYCADMPIILQNNESHPEHNLTLSKGTMRSHYLCGVCNLKHLDLFNYHCSSCKFSVHMICATISQQKMDHPGHPHQLQRMSKQLVSSCNACGHEHQGIFYHCTTCFLFWINEECALMPAKLPIGHVTNGIFTHSHPLTLVYSFSEADRKAKFYPECRVCKKEFFLYFWIYKCDKCQYYVHIDCVNSRTETFKSIFLHGGGGKTYKNFKDDDYPNLLHCPFPDKSYNLLKHIFFENEKESMIKEDYDEMLNHFSHQHPLILLDTQTSLDNKSVVLHNPMKKVQLLCDGCVKPIMSMPFYKCSQEFQSCGFALHEWCARLPFKVQDHPDHPEHTLFLMSKIPNHFFDVYTCYICRLPSNGFAYGCTTCQYYVDINCAYLPKEIVHEAHPLHLLSRTNRSNLSNRKCNACRFHINHEITYECPSCDFSLDIGCALLWPKFIRHKYDKHPLSLRYNPVENHPGDYFCCICEDEVNPRNWFYHCTFCTESMHPTCSSLIRGSEQAIYDKYKRLVFYFFNVKFGGTIATRVHPHDLAFVQGIKHGWCKECHEELQYEMIFECFECKYALHYKCASKVLHKMNGFFLHDS